jgi:hypothetical protein
MRRRDGRTARTISARGESAASELSPRHQKHEEKMQAEGLLQFEFHDLDFPPVDVGKRLRGRAFAIAAVPMTNQPATASETSAAMMLRKLMTLPENLFTTALRAPLRLARRTR